MSSPNDLNKQTIDEFRAHSGQVSGQFAGIPLLLLNTIGAKSGQPRTNPVAYVIDGDRYVIIATANGAPTNPDWYYNVLAHPLVTLEVGSERFQARATAAEGAERDRLYANMVEKIPAFAAVEKMTTRKIPVVVLTRKV
jgi:deazaflavin-dependent oxidoreductase (nitroreductase family)